MIKNPYDIILIEENDTWTEKYMVEIHTTILNMSSTVFKYVLSWVGITKRKAAFRYQFVLI